MFFKKFCIATRTIKPPYFNRNTVVFLASHIIYFQAEWKPFAHRDKPKITRCLISNNGNLVKQFDYFLLFLHTGGSSYMHIRSRFYQSKWFIKLSLETLSGI